MLNCKYIPNLLFQRIPLEVLKIVQFPILLVTNIDFKTNTAHFWGGDFYGQIINEIERRQYDSFRDQE